MTPPDQSHARADGLIFALGGICCRMLRMNTDATRAAEVSAALVFMRRKIREMESHGSTSSKADETIELAELLLSCAEDAVAVFSPETLGGVEATGEVLQLTLEAYVKRSEALAIQAERAAEALVLSPPCGKVAFHARAISGLVRRLVDPQLEEEPISATAS